VEEDLTWAELREPWQRLRWARRHAKYESARAAAGSLGENEATYSAYERRPDSSKHIPLSHQRAIQFAKKFKVRWQWLLIGEGEPWLLAPKREAPDVAEGKRILEGLPSAKRAEAIQILRVLGGRR